MTGPEYPPLVPEFRHLGHRPVVRWDNIACLHGEQRHSRVLHLRQSQFLIPTLRQGGAYHPPPSAAGHEQQQPHPARPGRIDSRWHRHPVPVRCPSLRARR